MDQFGSNESSPFVINTSPHDTISDLQPTLADPVNDSISDSFSSKPLISENTSPAIMSQVSFRVRIL